MNSALNDSPLLLVAPPDLADRIGGLLRVGGGVYAGTPVKNLSALNESISMARSQAPAIVPLVAALPTPQHGLGGMLAELARVPTWRRWC